MTHRAALLPLSSVLEWARAQPLTSAVIIGRLPDGTIRFASTSGDAEDCLALLREGEAYVRNPTTAGKRETEVVREA